SGMTVASLPAVPALASGDDHVPPVRREGKSGMLARQLSRFAPGVALTLLMLPAVAAAQPSQDLASYVLFGKDMVRLRGVAVASGDIGGNSGLLYMRGSVNAPMSNMAADSTKSDNGAKCDQLFTNHENGTPPACPHASGVPVPKPLIANVEAACS